MPDIDTFRQGGCGVPSVGDVGAASLCTGGEEL